MATEGLIRALQPRQGATGGGLGGTLQTIRQGGTLPQNTLAGQISNIRAQRQAAQQAMQQNLRDYLLDRRKAQTDARRKAVQSQTELDEMRRARVEQMNERMFGTSRQLLSLAQQSPGEARTMLVKSPKLAQALGVEPNSEDWQSQLQAAHDKYRAMVTGDIPDKEEDGRTTLEKQLISSGLEPGSAEYREALLRSIGGLEETEEGNRVMLVQGDSQQAGILRREYDVDIPSYETAEVEFGPDGRVVDVNRFGAETPTGPTPFQEKMSGIMGGIYGKNIEQGVRAPDTIRRLEAVEAALLSSQEEGFKTGFAGEIRQLASQAFSYFNVDPGIANLGEASPSEIIDSVTSRLGIDLAENISRPNTLQIKMIKRAIPNLQKTVQGNLILTSMLKQQAQRDKAISDIAMAYATHSKNGMVLDRPVSVAGVTLKPGTNFNDAIAKYDESVQKMDEATQQYIRNAAKWGKAKIAPIGDDGKIDPGSLQEGEIYLMPDGKVIEYHPDKSKVLDDLNREDDGGE